MREEAIVRVSPEAIFLGMLIKAAVVVAGADEDGVKVPVAIVGVGIGDVDIDFKASFGENVGGSVSECA